MTPEKYRELRSKLDLRPRLIPNLTLLLIDMALVAGGIAAIGKSEPLFVLGGQVMLGIAFLHGFGLIHEAAHGKVSRHALVNNLFGHFVGILAWTPFAAYRLAHREHHRYAGNVERDPILRVVQRLCMGSALVRAAVRMSWRVWIPLIAITQLAYVWTRCFHYLFSSREADLRKCAECVVSVMFTGLMLTVLTQAVGLNVALLAPALVLYLKSIELLHFPQYFGVTLLTGHERLSPHQQFLVTRSHLYPKWIARFFYLNQNLQTEHHVIPEAPWTQLDRASIPLRKELGHLYNHASGVHWDRVASSTSAADALVTDLARVQLAPAARGETGRPFRFGNANRKFLMLFPRSIRNMMLRSRIHLDRAPSLSLQIKLAQGKEELEQAYRLLHDSYVAQGLMQKQASGIRISKYNTLPSTSTLIAKYDGKVVGTVSIIRDSSFGFPLEKTYDVSFLSKSGARVAEITSLAIHPDFDRKQGEVLFPLLKYMYEYCERFFGVDYMVIAAPEDHFPLYEGVLLFRKLRLRATAENDLLNTGACVGGYLHLRTAYQKFEEKYGKKAPEQNLFTYFTKLRLPNFIFPERRFKTISDPVLTPELFNHFFNERTNVARVLTEQERRILWRLYENPAFRMVLPRPAGGGGRAEDRRTEARFEVKCDGKAHFVDGNRRVHMDIRDVSDNGFQAVLDAPIRFGTPVRVDLAISDKDTVTLKVFPVWVKGENTYGFRIQEASDAWRYFLQHLTTDLRKVA